MNIGRHPRPGVKRQVFDAAQMVLFYSGAASLFASIKKHNPFTILMYHSICDASNERWIAPRNRVSVKNFETQIRYLARHRNPLSLDDLVDYLERGREVPKQSVLLTFDDGYRDTLEAAAPILDRYGVPATLYLATAYVDRGENQWEDQLYSYYIHATNFPVEPEARYRATQQALISSSAAERRTILDAERARLRPNGTPERTTMVWDEVRDLHHRYKNFTLGVHTHEHADLTSLKTESALEEVERSITRFRDELGYSPEHFSFPYCRVNYAVCDKLGDLGLRSAMTESGVQDGEYGTPWDLRRLESLENLSRIRYWTSGAYPGLSTYLFGRA